MGLGQLGLAGGGGERPGERGSGVRARVQPPVSDVAGGLRIRSSSVVAVGEE